MKYPEYTNAAGHTHKVSIYGIRCYFNEHTHEVQGCNAIWDVMLPLVIIIHAVATVFKPDEAGVFPLRVIEDYRKRGDNHGEENHK